MRIAVIAPLHHYRKYYADENHNSLFYYTQAQSGWVRALRTLGHNVLEIRNTDYTGNLRLDTILNSNTLLRRTVNWLTERRWLARMAMFPHRKSCRDLEVVLRFGPDIIILSGGNWLSIYTPEFFRQLRMRLPNAAIFLMNGMSPYFYKITVERQIMQIVDCVFTNDPSHCSLWRALGASRSLSLPLGAMPIEGWGGGVDGERPIDIAFIGTVYRSRCIFFEQLAALGVGIKVWGTIGCRIGHNAPFWSLYEGPVQMDLASSIYGRAKIALNIHDSSMPVGGNMRTFEIPAYGAVQLADRCPGEWFVNGEEIVLFSDLQDLVAKCGQLLASPERRAAIAVRAMQRLRAEHTYQARITKLLSVAAEIRDRHAESEERQSLLHKRILDPLKGSKE